MIKYLHKKSQFVLRCPSVPGAFYTMANKSYKSYRQQLNILRSRGMVIGKGSQGSRVMRILERENYYNVINGYKELFLASKATATADEAYKTGTTFDEVYALYNFDRELRNIYLKYLLKLENTFKTVIAHEFSAKYGHDNYLKIENFDNSTERNISSSIKLIGDIQQEIARQMSKHHQVVTHYITEHGYIPLWVLVNVLTFGKIENFSVLGIVRAADGSYTYGTNDAYAIAIMFALLLSKSDLNDFISSMRTAFGKLQKQLHTISAADIMSIMGYDTNWTNLVNLI